MGFTAQSVSTLLGQVAQTGFSYIRETVGQATELLLRNFRNAVNKFAVALAVDEAKVSEGVEYFDVNAFTYPTLGTFSPVKRNSFVGPGYIQTDMNIARQFGLTGIREGMYIMFRADAFNVFNTPNLANPKAGFSCSSTSITFDPRQGATNTNNGKGCLDLVSTTSGGVTTLSPIGSESTTFGTIQSTFGNNANTSTNGRKMQFALQLYF